MLQQEKRAARAATALWLSDQVPECGNDLLVDLALERHDEVRQLLHRPPRPLIEFGRVTAGRRVDLDLALVALEAVGEPFLRLTAIAALEGDADQMRRQVIVDPVRRLGEKRHAA